MQSQVIHLPLIGVSALSILVFSFRVLFLSVLMSKIVYIFRYSFKVVDPVEDQSDRVFRMRPLEKADLEVISPWFQDIEDLGRFDRK